MSLFDSKFGLMDPFKSSFGLADPFESFYKSLDFHRGAMGVMNTDVIEKDGNVELIMDLPGTKKEDIKIKLEEGNLIISATTSSKKSTEEDNDKGHYIRKERQSGSYTRSFYVGENITEDDIKAKFEDGTLSVTFPKEKPPVEPEEKFICIE
ncbi:MAG: Hsp20/alpha crystallin family protein [Acutalibacteraceae bacterium]